MANATSNSEIMRTFKAIDELKKESLLGPEALAKEIRGMQNEIIDNLSFLVYIQAKPYKRFGNYDDMVQEGLVGLIKAVQVFEWARFPNFFVFAGQWIRHSVKRAASRFDIVYNPTFARVVYAEPDDTEEAPDASPEEEYFSKERCADINRALYGFPDREREIVQRLFGLGGLKQLTLRETGQMFGLSHERVRQIKDRVVGKLSKNAAIIGLMNLD